MKTANNPARKIVPLTLHDHEKDEIKAHAGALDLGLATWGRLALLYLARMPSGAERAELEEKIARFAASHPELTNERRDSGAALARGKAPKAKRARGR